MKDGFFLIILLFFVVAGCEKRPKEYSNVTIAQVIDDFKWDSNYDEVENILENNYGLDYLNQIKQSKSRSSKDFKVYEFEGGKLNGINTWHWTVSFYKDSLSDVLIKFSTKSINRKVEIFEALKNSINNLAYTKYSKIDNEWVLEENEKAIGRIQIDTSMGNGTYFSLSSTRWLKNYSYK